MKEFIEKYKTPLIYTGLLLIVYFLYFHNLWAYKLLDTDETRYVDMAKCMHNSKDYMTLYLNNTYFFEKPPLYFWLENLSFSIFNTINEFTARIPGVIESVFSGIILFFVTKKYTNNSKKALISALILISSTEFVILGKIAILDILLATTVGISILFGFMTFITNGKLKNLYWLGFYMFSAFAVLAKGIPGFVLPFGIMFFAGIYSKKLKEFFRPQYLLSGLTIFLLIILPWHLIMLDKYNPLFFNEYIIKHHIARFLGADSIHRQRPFWYYIPVILWGTLPYAASFIALLIEKIKNIKTFKYVPFANLSNDRQFTVLCIIASVFTFLFFSASGTKLVTYILPIYPFLAVIIGNYWVEYIDNNEHKKGIEISSNILLYTLLIAGILSFFVFMFFPEPLKSDLYTIRIPVLIGTVIFPIWGIYSIINNKRMQVFLSLLLFITYIGGFVFHKALEMDYRFGQNDLIEYAKYSHDNNLKLNVFRMNNKYSLLYYSGQNVNYDIDVNDIDKIQQNKSNIIVIKRRDLNEIKGKKYTVIREGRKFLLIK